MRIVFIADNFADSYIGGSELSIQSHIDTCPYKFIKIKSRELKLRHLKDDDFLVFGNFYDMPIGMLKEFQRFNYVVEECDYKYCKYRSSHLHRLHSPAGCDCPQTYSAPIINFFLHAQHIFWKSEGQRDEYYRLFPELKDKPSAIMGGVFTDEQLDYIISLKDYPHDERYFVLKTNKWIKGYRESVAYCVKNSILFREAGDLPYKQSLVEMAKCKGLVYMPTGFDPSCRMVTEMKLLGREIITNNNMQHMKEAWFNSGEAGMLEFLRSRNKIFWGVIDGLCAIKI